MIPVSAAAICATHQTTTTESYRYPARVSSWQMTTNAIADENAVKVHAPKDIAERGLKTRNMFKKRDGRPRSAISKGAEMTPPANPNHEAARVSPVLAMT